MDKLRILETIIVFKVNKQTIKCANNFNTILRIATAQHHKHSEFEDLGEKILTHHYKHPTPGHYFNYTWIGTDQDVEQLHNIIKEDKSAIKYITFQSEKTTLPPLTDVLDIIYHTPHNTTDTK